MSVKELQNIISPNFTEEVLHKIIAKAGGLSEIKVNKIDMGAASKKGDSYMSNICRFTVEAKGKNTKGVTETVSIPVITKFLSKNVARVKTYRANEFFENEVLFFENVWAEFQTFQEEEKITEKFDNLPVVLATHIDGTNDFVSMIDLGHDGYRSAERGAGLNYEHAVVILQILARFHAVSLAFKEKQPEKFEKIASSLKEVYFSERLRSWNGNFQKRIIAVWRDAIEKESPEYLPKFDNFVKQDLYGLLIEACLVRGPLAVITHGDVWVPNFLIKYQGAKPENVIMIDFQLARYTTLVTDLLFFLYSCVDLDLVEKKWDDLIGEYHKALNIAQKNFHCKNLISIDLINKELKEHSVMGVWMSMEALIMSQLDDDDVADLDGVQGTEALPLETIWYVAPFKDQEKRKRLAQMINLAVGRNFV